MHWKLSALFVSMLKAKDAEPAHTLPPLMQLTTQSEFEGQIICAPKQARLPIQFIVHGLPSRQVNISSRHCVRPKQLQKYKKTETLCILLYL